MKIINENIRKLITRSLAGEATPKDKTELQQWLAENTQHQAMYEEYKKTWALQPGRSEDIRINRTLAWEKINQKIRLEETASEPTVISLPKPSRKLFYAISAIAAMILLFIGIFTFVPRSAKVKMISYQHTDLSETAEIALPDGTVVYFNGKASITYPEQFTGNKRQVKLKGNAFFEVAKNEEMTFVINMDHAALEVLGTSFDIRQQPDKIMVSVTTGMVALIHGTGERLIIRKEERGIYNTDTQHASLEEIKDYNFLAWKTRKLEFQEAPLDKVFSDLMLAYPIQIEWPGELAEEKLTARFENEDPETILSSIEILFDLEIEKENDFYKVSQ